MFFLGYGVSSVVWPVIIAQVRPARRGELLEGVVSIVSRSLA